MYLQDFSLGLVQKSIYVVVILWVLSYQNRLLVYFSK